MFTRSRCSLRVAIPVRPNLDPLVIWDSGSDPIPIDAVPPSTSRDPHGDPRNDPEARRQKAAFLFEGELIDVCDAAACTAAAG